MRLSVRQKRRESDLRRQLPVDASCLSRPKPPVLSRSWTSPVTRDSLHEAFQLSCSRAPILLQATDRGGQRRSAVHRFGGSANGGRRPRTIGLLCRVCVQRHGSAVHALVAIDAVLVSAEWEGRICVWKFENNDFVIAKELDVPGKLTCLKDLCVARPLGDSATAPTPGDTERRFLWAGGTGLTIIDLASMNVVCSLDISDSACARGRERRPMPLALSLVAYENSMLVGFSSGVVKAYSASGQEQFRYDKSAYLSTMAGVMSPDGPLLLFGGPRGAFHALTLPQFEETGQLSAHEEGDVKSILFLSSEFFVTCGEDSVICVWRWAKPQTASSAPS